LVFESKVRPLFKIKKLANKQRVSTQNLFTN